jgi:TPR repeat protein
MQYLNKSKNKLFWSAKIKFFVLRCSHISYMLRCAAQKFNFFASKSSYFFSFHSSFKTSLILTLSLITASCDKVPAMIYETGHQVQRVGWDLKGQNGDIEAQHDAAKLNCCGQRPLRDDVHALNLYCEAASDAHPQSQLAVGKMYEHAFENMSDGTIIPLDRGLAYVYYSRAADLGNKEAAGRKASLFQNMSVEEFKRGQELKLEYPDIPCKITR